MDDLWAMKSEDVGLIARAVSFQDFYRAMHFAKRGPAIACRLSVRLSVTLVDHG